MMNVANIMISNIDDQAKQNFEQLCVSFNMNTATAFSALVKIGMSIKEQGMFSVAAKTDVVPAETQAKSHLSAFEQFVSANRAIHDEPITEEFDAIIASGVSIGRELDL